MYQRSLPFITWLKLTQLRARAQPLVDSFPGLRRCRFFSERWSSSWKAPSRRCGFHVRSYELSPACPWPGTSQWLYCHSLNETIDTKRKKSILLLNWQCSRVLLPNFRPVFEEKWEARWPHDQCARLRLRWSGFEPRPGTLRCVPGQDILLPQCLFPPRCINEYRLI